MKNCLCVLLFVFSPFSYAIDDSILFETKSFLIKIKVDCVEKEAVCNDVSYTGIRKSDGVVTYLKGKALNTLCKLSDCDFYGYEFKNGEYIYKIYGRFPESLLIEKEGERVLYEKGQLFSDIKKFNDFTLTKKNNHKFSLLGNPIISRYQFVHETNNRCDFPSYEDERESQCEIIGLEFYYTSVWKSIDGEKEILGGDNQTKYYLRKRNVGENEREITFFIEHNRRVVDRLKVYSEKISETAAIAEYYYIDEQMKNVWITQILADETNRRVGYWKHYQLDNSKHFNLIESVECKYKEGEVDTAICL